MYSHRLRVINFVISVIIFVIFGNISVKAVEPAFPSCPAGSTKVLEFGPYLINNRVVQPIEIPTATKTFTNVSSATSGSIVVWQGEGHNWDLNCNEGWGNDTPDKWSCDDQIPNEIAIFYINNIESGRFIDHNPDDDRQFLYNFPVSNFINNSNIFRVDHINATNPSAPSSSAWVKGVVCTNNPPTATSTPICPTKATGDANCDGQITLVDFEFWRREFQGTMQTKNADFNNSTTPDLADFEIWRSNAFN